MNCLCGHPSVILVFLSLICKSGNKSPNNLFSIMCHLSMYEQDILHGISKGTFEIPHKISCSYIARFDFDTKLKFWEFLDLRVHKCFRNTSQASKGVNPFRPKQNGCHSANHISKCIFWNENFQILIKISLNFVLKGPIDFKSALVYIQWLSVDQLTNHYLK